MNPLEQETSPPIYLRSHEQDQALSALRPVGRAWAIESALGIGPGRLRSSPTGVGETEVSAWRTRRVIVLEARRLFPSGEFNPAQSLQHRKVNYEAVESTTLSLVGHEIKISLSQLLYVLWIDTALLAFGHFFFCSCCPIDRSGFHQRHLVVMEDIGLARTNFVVN